MAQRVGHGGLGHARDRHDVAGLGQVDRGLGQAAEGHDLADAELLQPLAVARQRFQRVAGPGGARLDAPGQQTAQEGIGAKRGRQHLERLVRAGDLLGRLDVLQDQVEQRVHVLALAVQRRVGPTADARGIDMRKVQLLVAGAQVGEQVEHVVQRLVGLGCGLVDLVQHDDRAQAQGKRLGGHELGLGHRAFGRIDQQADAVDHRQDAFDLAAEIGVAGRVDDVDARALPFDRGCLGQNGDAAFAFDVVAVHRAFRDGLVVAEGPRLTQQLVHQGGFAVVDVSDDGDVADIHDGLNL